MALTNDQITAQNLKDFYDTIFPYLNGNGMIYSTTEKAVGKWINGETLYQKTVTTGGSVPTGATLIERITQTGYDTLRYTK